MRWCSVRLLFRLIDIRMLLVSSLAFSQLEVLSLMLLFEKIRLLQDLLSLDRLLLIPIGSFRS